MREEILKKLIFAWRESKKVSDGLERIFETTFDLMYDVHGNILDAIREYAFETGEIDDSEILQMLNSDMTATEIAHKITVMHEKYMLNSSPLVKQPAPKFFTDEQIERMQRVFGGYVHDAK